MSKEISVKTEDEIFYPMLAPLIIDKLSIVKNFPDHYRPLIKEKFNNILSNFGIPCYSNSYFHGYKLSDNSHDYEGLVALYCDPVNPHNNFFKLVMNPSRADLPFVKAVVDMIIPDGYSGLLLNGTVNQIDTAVDIHNVKIADLVAEYPKMKTEGHHGMGASKQTKHIGSKSSKNQICLYDKKQQLHALKAKSSYGYMIPAPPIYDMARIEFRQYKTKKTLSQIGKSNPYEKLSLKHIKSCDHYDPTWELFRTVMQDRGVKSALRHFNNPDRKKFRERFEKEGTPAWLNPAEIWNGFSSALSDLTNVQSYSPHMQFT